jgi:polyamine oxidase
MASLLETSDCHGLPGTDAIHKRKTKVIVIGAGAAGCGAARWLLDNDVEEQLEVVVIEGRSRVGGRVHTIMDFGVPVDCGAAWLHDHEEGVNPISIMADCLGLSSNLRNTDWDNSIPFALDGTRISDKEADGHWSVLEKAFVEAVQTRSAAAADAKEEEKKRSSSSSSSAGSLEALIKNIVGPRTWASPSFQSWLCDYDFEFGSKYRRR